MPQTFRKDPDDVLDYQVDATDWLNTSPEDDISTATWTVPAGITKDSETNTTKKARIWLSGGTAGQVYKCTVRVTSVLGRQKDWSIKIIVNEH